MSNESSTTNRTAFQPQQGPATWSILAGVIAGSGGLLGGDLPGALLAAAAAASAAWSLLGIDHGLAATSVRMGERHARLLHGITKLNDIRALQRGVFEVSSELVGCVEEADARTRFVAALRRYWDCDSADLLVWERGAWRSLGGTLNGQPPMLDQPVQLPHAKNGDLVLDLSPGVSGQAALVLHRARPQPSLADRSPDEQLAVAETLRGQLALSLRRVMLYGDLQALARVDPLTATHRRWYGEQRLKELVDGGDVVAVAMVDIDRFKLVNDHHGHSVGDQVLAAVGRTLVAGLRSNDLVCRWGGEEFLLILPDTPPDGAMLVSERLRVAVAALADLPVTVTVSIGIASCAQDDTHFEVVARADEALYQAKHEGRNQVIMASAAGTTESRQIRKLSRRARTRSFTKSGEVPAIQPNV